MNEINWILIWANIGVFSGIFMGFKDFSPEDSRYRDLFLAMLLGPFVIPIAWTILREQKKEIMPVYDEEGNLTPFYTGRPEFEEDSAKYELSTYVSERGLEQFSAK